MTLVYAIFNFSEGKLLITVVKINKDKIKFGKRIHSPSLGPQSQAPSPPLVSMRGKIQHKSYRERGEEAGRAKLEHLLGRKLLLSSHCSEIQAHCMHVSLVLMQSMSVTRVSSTTNKFSMEQSEMHSTSLPALF